MERAMFSPPFACSTKQSQDSKETAMVTYRVRIIREKIITPQLTARLGALPFVNPSGCGRPTD
jgi:hypothetical protein